MSDDKAYKDGDIVWVKLGNNWWPGEVTGSHRHPDGLVKHLKRIPYCVVKFFNEDTFEYVRSAKQIFPFQCAKKDEFLRKGYSLFKSGNSFMEKFPEDVEVAERLTLRKDASLIINDRPDSIVKAILGQPLIRTCDEYYDGSEYREKRRSGDSVTKIINITSNRNPTSEMKLAAPLISKPFLTASTYVTLPTKTPFATNKHEICKEGVVSSKIDATTNKSTTLNNNNYQCNLCEFTSVRQNVMILHRKMHSNRNVTARPTTATAKTTSSATITTNQQQLNKTSVINNNNNIIVSKTKANATVATRTTATTIPVKVTAVNERPVMAVTTAAPTIPTTSPIRMVKAAALPVKPITPKVVTSKKKEAKESAYSLILSDFCLSETETSIQEEKTSRRSLRHCRNPLASPAIVSTSSNIPTICIDLPETPKLIKKIPKKRDFISLHHQQEPQELEPFAGMVVEETSHKQKAIVENDVILVTPRSPLMTPKPKEDAEEIRKMLLADWSDEDETPNENNEDGIIADDRIVNRQKGIVALRKSNDEFCSSITTVTSTPIVTATSAGSRIRNIPKKDRRDIVLQEFQSELSTIETEQVSTKETMVVHLDSSNSSVVEIIEDEHQTTVITINDDEDMEEDNPENNKSLAETQPSKEFSDSVLSMNNKNASAATSTATLSCFDFQDEEEDEDTAVTTISHFKKKYLSVEKLQNLLTTTEGEADNKTSKNREEMSEKDQQLSSEIESLLEQTQPSANNLLKVNSLEETISVKDLPIKERGKRIFKSRNKSRLEEKSNPDLTNNHSLEDNSNKEMLVSETDGSASIDISLTGNEALASQETSKTEQEVINSEKELEIIIDHEKLNDEQEIGRKSPRKSISEHSNNEILSPILLDNLLYVDDKQVTPNESKENEDHTLENQESVDLSNGELKTPQEIPKEQETEKELVINDMSSENNNKTIDPKVFIEKDEESSKPESANEPTEPEFGFKLKESSNDPASLVETQKSFNNLQEHDETTIDIEACKEVVKSTEVPKELEENIEETVPEIAEAITFESKEILIENPGNEVDEIRTNSENSINSITSIETATDNNAENYQPNDNAEPEILQTNIENEDYVANKLNDNELSLSENEHENVESNGLENENLGNAGVEDKIVANDSVNGEEESTENFYKIRVKSEEQLFNQKFVESPEEEQDLALTNEETSDNRLITTTPTDENSSMGASDTGAEFGSPTSMLSEERFPTFRYNSDETPQLETEIEQEEVSKDDPPVKVVKEENDSCKKEVDPEKKQDIETLPKSILENQCHIKTIFQRRFSMDSKSTQSKEKSVTQHRLSMDESLNSNQNQKTTLDVSKLSSPNLKNPEDGNRPRNRHMKTTPRRNVRELFKNDFYQLNTILSVGTTSHEVIETQTKENEIEMPNSEEISQPNEKSIASSNNETNVETLSEKTLETTEENLLGTVGEKEDTTMENIIQIVQENDNLAESEKVTENIVEVKISQAEVNKGVEKENEDLTANSTAEELISSVGETLLEKTTESCALTTVNSEESLTTTDEDTATKESERTEEVHLKQTPQSIVVENIESSEMENSKKDEYLIKKSTEIETEPIELTNSAIDIVETYKDNQEFVTKQPIKLISSSNQKKRSGEIILLVEPKQRKRSEVILSIKQINQDTENIEHPPKIPTNQKTNSPTKEHVALESNAETAYNETCDEHATEKSENVTLSPIISSIPEEDIENSIPNHNRIMSSDLQKSNNEHVLEAPYSPGVPPATPQEREVIIECDSSYNSTVTSHQNDLMIESETVVVPSTPKSESIAPPPTPQQKDSIIEREIIVPHFTPTQEKEFTMENDTSIMITPATTDEKDMIIESEPATPQSIIECDYAVPALITPEKEVIADNDIVMPTLKTPQEIECKETLPLHEKESLIEREYQVIPPNETATLTDVQQESNNVQTDADKAAEEFLIEFDNIVNHSHSVEEDVHNTLVEEVMNPEDLINNIIEEVHEDITKQDLQKPYSPSPLQQPQLSEPLTTYTVLATHKDSLSQLFNKQTTSAAIKRRQTICFEISDKSDSFGAAACKKQAFDFESIIPMTKAMKRTAERKLTLPAIETKSQQHQVMLNRKLIPTTKRKLSIEDNITSFIIERPKQQPPQQTNPSHTGPPPLQRIRNLGNRVQKISKTFVENTSVPTLLQSTDHLLQNLFQSTSRSTSPLIMESGTNQRTEGGRVIHQQILNGPSITTITKRRLSETTKISKNKQIGIDTRGNKYVIIKTPPTDILVQPSLTSAQQQSGVTVPQTAAAEAATTSNNFGGTTLTISPISLASKAKVTNATTTKVKHVSAARKQQQLQQQQLKQQSQTTQISITVPAASTKMQILKTIKKRKTPQTRVQTSTQVASSNTNNTKHKEAIEALSRRLSIAAEAPPLAKIPRTGTHVQTQIANTSNLSAFFADTQISTIAQQQLIQLQQQHQQQQQSQQTVQPPIILNKNAHQQSVIQRKARKTTQQQQQQLLQHQQAQAKSAQLLQQIQMQQQNVLHQQQQLQQQQQQQQHHLQQQFITQITNQQQHHNSLQPPPLQPLQQPQQQQLVQQHQTEGVIITTAAAPATDDDDVIDSNTQLIALPTTPYPGYAETFLLCKVKGNTCKPVDNVPLYLNHQLNELVPVPLEALEGGHKTQEHQIEIKPNNSQQQHLLTSNDNQSHDGSSLQITNLSSNGGMTDSVVDTDQQELHHQLHQQHHLQQQQQQQLIDDNSEGDNVADNGSNNQLHDFAGNQNTVSNELVTNNGILLNIEGQQVLLDAATFSHLLANPDANTQLISDDGTEYVLTHEVLAALQMQQHQQQALELATAAVAVEQQQPQQNNTNDILAVALAGSDLYGNDVLTIDTSQGMQLIDGDGSIVFQPQTVAAMTQQHLTPPAVVTNAVLDQSPIMSALEVPSSIATGHKLQGTHMITVPASHHLATSTALGINSPSNLEDSLAAIGVTTHSMASMSSSLGLPITVTNPNIASKVTSAGPLNEMLQFVSHRPATAAATAAAVAAAALAGESRIFTD